MRLLSKSVLGMAPKFFNQLSVALRDKEYISQFKRALSSYLIKTSTILLTNI